MKRFVMALAVLTAFGVSTVGCGGDDDDDDNGTAGTSGKASTGDGGEPAMGAGGKPATGEGGSPSMNLGCDVEADTTCQNPMDCPFVVDGSARMSAQTCGKGECLASEDPNCARDCVLKELEMSSECAACYADFVNCTKAKCLGECLTDPNSDKCHTCQEDEGCRPDFNECSGLPTQ
jgi:hypothetical protein